MVDFSLTREQLELQRLAREFAEKEIKPIAALYDRCPDPSKCVPLDVVRKAAKLGFTTLIIPEKYGGVGGKELDVAILSEELAKADIGLAETIMSNNAFVRPIIAFGTEEQKEKWLREICRRKEEPYLLAFAATEPESGSDSASPDPRLGIKTRAVKDGKKYIINGRKCFITNGGIASLYIVFARTDPTKGAMGGVSAFLIEKDTPGFSIGKIEDKMGHRLSQQAELIFEDVEVPEEMRLGEEGDGFLIMMDFVAGSGPGVGALSVGLATAAFEYAKEYAKNRYQGGNYIIYHQAIGFKLVDMKIKIECARNLVWKACWYNDNVGRSNELSAMAKIYATDMAMQVCEEAVQILGGYGYMKDHPVEKWMRDAKLGQIYDGTNEALRLALMMLL